MNDTLLHDFIDCERFLFTFQYCTITFNTKLKIEFKLASFLLMIRISLNI